MKRLRGFAAGSQALKKSSSSYVFDFPAGPLCRGYHKAILLQEGIFFRALKQISNFLSLGLRMNPFYWVLKPLWRLTIYPFWRFLRWMIYRHIVILPARLHADTFPQSETVDSQIKPLGVREIVKSQVQTRFQGHIELRLWRHDSRRKTCVICFPQPSSKGYLSSCLWPIEKKELPTHWIQYDYRQTGQSLGQSCRFEDLVDDAQGVLTYAKAFLGLSNIDFIFLAEGFGSQIAYALSARLEERVPIFPQKEKEKALWRNFSLKGLLAWFMGWPFEVTSLKDHGDLQESEVQVVKRDYAEFYQEAARMREGKWRQD